MGWTLPRVLPDTGMLGDRIWSIVSLIIRLRVCGWYILCMGCSIQCGSACLKINKHPAIASAKIRHKCKRVLAPQLTRKGLLLRGNMTSSSEIATYKKRLTVEVIVRLVILRTDRTRKLHSDARSVGLTVPCHKIIKINESSFRNDIRCGILMQMLITSWPKSW